MTDLDVDGPEDGMATLTATVQAGPEGADEEVEIKNGTLQLTAQPFYAEHVSLGPGEETTIEHEFDVFGPTTFFADGQRRFYANVTVDIPDVDVPDLDELDTDTDADDDGAGFGLGVAALAIGLLMVAGSRRR